MRANRGNLKVVFVVFLVALLIRGLVAGMAVGDAGPLGWLGLDPDAYRLIAETLATTGTFGIPAADGRVDPTAFRPPLYPWLLSWLTFTPPLPQGAGGDAWQPEQVGQLSLIGVAVLHSFLGAITAAATTVAVRALRTNWQQPGREQDQQKSSRIELFAGLLVAIDPLLLMQSTLVMTETLATSIAAVAWTVFAISDASFGSATEERSRLVSFQQGTGFKKWAGCWFLAGVLLALGYLCRPTFIVWTALMIAWIGARALFARTDRWRHLLAAGFIALPTIITVTAWTMRNASVVGKPVWATTHGGYTLLLGNNPYFYDYLRERSFLSAGVWGEAWDAEPFHQDWKGRLGQLRLSEQEMSGRNTPVRQAFVEVDRELLEDELAADWAKETMSAAPGMFVYASLVRVARLWSPVPRVGKAVSAASIVLGIYYSALYLTFGWGLLRLIRRKLGGRLAAAGLISALMLLVSLTAVHAVYWSNVRMRAPAMPIVIGLAALSVGGLRSPLGRGKH